MFCRKASNNRGNRRNTVTIDIAEGDIADGMVRNRIVFGIVDHLYIEEVAMLNMLHAYIFKQHILHCVLVAGVNGQASESLRTAPGMSGM